MRHILFLLFMAFTLQAIAQYPATGNKARLGWQTTGDGLVYRGAIGDTATLDPSGINNAWMLLDTANGNLYAYRAKAWRLVSGGGGSVSDTLTGEVKGPLDSTYIDTVANIIFTTTTDTTVGVGELEYNDTQGSLVQGLKGGNVTNVIGQQIHQRVTNATGAPLTKGTAVFLHGSQGNRITVRKALATVDSTSANTFGIVAESIANNQSGYVITEGLITNMNTNALTEGAAVYLSPTVAGELTTTKPQAPQHTVYIGVCVKQNAGSGELFVKIRNGQELDELHDVRIDSLASNASLYYNAAQGVWRDTGAAVLVADTSAMLSPYLKKADTLSLSNRINTKLNISDTSVFARDFQISGTAGQVAYFNAANAVTSDTAFRWSAANKTLSINTSTTSGANIIIKNSQEPSRSTVVANQDFAADTTNWTRGTGWTFNGTAAVATAATGNLTYTPALTITSGNAYEVTYTISGYSAGTLTVAVGNATYALPRQNATDNVVVLLPTSATGGFRFTTSTFTGNLDNVSVVQIASPAPVLLAGQDDNSTTLYSSLVIPNSTSFTLGGGGRYITGNNNLANGYQALQFNTTGNNNTANGFQALQFNTTGSSNVANGYRALYSNTTGSNNTANGYQALYFNTTGGLNSADGYQALYFNTTGTNNIANGYQALILNTTGSSNIANGQQALYFNTTGSSNAAIGYRALYSNTTGSNNVAIGADAMYNTITADTLTGSNNVAIGRNAADNIRAAAAANVAIGNQVDLPTSNGSNQGVYQNVLFFTGASGTGTTIAAGSRAGIKTNAPASDFHVAGEVRIDDLKPTGTPRNIVGSSSTGDLSTMAWGNGLTVSVGDTILRADTSVLASKTWVNNKINADTISLSNRINTKLNISDTSVFARDFQISGTTNRLVMFTGSNTVGNSWFSQSDSVMTLNDTKKMQLYGRNGRRNYLEIFRGGTNTMQTNYVLATDTAYTASTGTTSRVYTHAVDNQNADYMISTYSGGGTGGFILLDAVRTGVGLNNPVNRLDVEGAAAIGATYAGGFTAPTNGLLVEGNVGIGTSSPSRPLHVAGTTAIRIPVGNLAQRGTSGAGDIRVRSDTANLEFHNGTSWQTVINNADTSVFARDVQISGTANYLPKFTGSNAVGNSGVFESGGNVGIGITTVPYAKLNVNNSIRITDGGTGAGSDALGGSQSLYIGNDGGGTLMQYNAKRGLDFWTYGGTFQRSVTLDSTGKLGIGTNAPVYQLHVDGEAGIELFSNTTNGRVLNFRPSLSAFKYIQSISAEDLASVGAATGLSINAQGGVAFSTNSSTSLNERMRIDASGNVGINTTTPSRRLHVEGETRISDLTTDPATRIVGADADGDLDAITIGNGVTFSSDTLKADTSVLATKAYVTNNTVQTIFIPINLYAPGDTVANTTNSKAFFLVHSGLNGYCIDSYTVKAFSGSGTADIQIDKNGTGGNLQAISGTTVATKDTNIALATGDYIRGQVFNLSGTLVGLGLTLEIKKTCN